jgi:hypothetical protein
MGECKRRDVGSTGTQVAHPTPYPGALGSGRLVVQRGGGCFATPSQVLSRRDIQFDPARSQSGGEILGGPWILVVRNVLVGSGMYVNLMSTLPLRLLKSWYVGADGGEVAAAAVALPLLLVANVWLWILSHQFPGYCESVGVVGS